MLGWGTGARAVAEETEDACGVVEFAREEVVARGKEAPHAREGFASARGCRMASGAAYPCLDSGSSGIASYPIWRGRESVGEHFFHDNSYIYIYKTIYLVCWRCSKHTN